MNINLHIERLVLEGLPVQAGHGPAIQAALEGELRRLLQERGLDSLTSGAFPRLSAAPIHLAADSQPTQWARQIARSLFAGLAPGPSRPASAKAFRQVTPSAAASQQPGQDTVSLKQPHVSPLRRTT